MVQIPASDRSSAKCIKPESRLPESLKPCAKCKTALYCSRECLKKDWKVHKRECSPNSAIHSNPSTPFATPTASDTPSGATTPDEIMIPTRAAEGIPTTKIPRLNITTVASLLTALSVDNFHCLPEDKIFEPIIDYFRLRVSEVDHVADYLVNIYNEANPLPAFKIYLKLAEKRGSI